MTANPGAVGAGWTALGVLVATVSAGAALGAGWWWAGGDLVGRSIGTSFYVDELLRGRAFDRDLTLALLLAIAGLTAGVAMAWARTARSRDLAVLALAAFGAGLVACATGQHLGAGQAAADLVYGASARVPLTLGATTALVVGPAAAVLPATVAAWVTRSRSLRTDPR